MIARVLPLLLAAAVAQPQKGRVEDAWKLVARGERAQAVRLLDTIVQANPADADARLLLGSLLMEAGDRDRSIAQLTEAVRLRPKSAEAENALGEAYRAFGESKHARQCFEQAAALDPKLAVAHVNLALVLLEGEEHEPAKAHLDRAIALLGNKKDAAYPLYLRAKLYTEANDVQKAAAALQRSVALDPGMAEAWSDLGTARKALGDDAAALAAFRRAVEISPDDEVAQTRLGTEYLARADAGQAVLHFQEAVRINPRDQSALNGLQRALHAAGRDAEAAEVRRQLAELLRDRDRSDQNSLAALRLNNEGVALEKAGQLRQAAEKYRAAHERDPGHLGIQVNYAICLLRTGEWKEGLAELRDALRRDPENAKLKAALEDALTQAPVEFGGKGRTRTPDAGASGTK